MKVMGRAVVVVLGAASALALASAPAGAHVSPDKPEVPANGYTAVAFTVGHGCEASPTRQVAIQVPGSLLDVTPAVVPGWAVEVAVEPLAEPVEGAHGEEVTERESVVTYTAEPGHELPDGFRQSFTLGFKAPDAPGERMLFKTIQTCVEGETAWIEEPTDGGEEPEHPAPVVVVTPAVDDAGDDGDDGADAGGAETIATEQAAATSDADGDDDGAATGLAVAGLVMGVLGLGAGTAALVRTRRAA